jgi:hypothetical protein
VELARCLTGRLESADDIEVVLRDTVVDAAGGQAIAMPEATVEMERVTVAANHDDLAGGPAVVVLVLEASEVIFDELVVALDQFRGCIRYSRIEVGSKVPRRHHVVDVERNASGVVVPDALGNPVPIRPSFVTRDRNDPAHLRLSDRCRREIARGAEDGSEMGAFHGVRLAQRTEAMVRRLFDFTPAGLFTGIVRLD